MLNPVQEAAAAMRQGRPDAALSIILRKLHQTPSAQALNIFRRACPQLGLATFNEQARSGSDVLFHAACAGAGMKVRLADPFNYLAIRSDDLEQHIWRVDAALLATSRDTALIGGIDAIDRYVAV